VNCSLYDEQGRRFVDLESGSWAAVVGHSHPRVNRAMTEQIAQVVHLGYRYPNALAEAAARDVLAITGIEDGKCVFLSSGSEAVEFGVEIARRATERPLLLTFANSYLAAYGSAGKKSSAEWHLLDWSAGTSDEVDERVNTIPFDRIGAFVFEPGGSGSAFVHFPPNALVADLARRVRQAGGLLVANEITTGMGRTGRWFGFQHYDFAPDIVALGKGLGNGYPVSAVAMRRDVAERVETSGLRYAQSHQNDPLGCAVAREVIAVLREQSLIERGRAMGRKLLDALERFPQKHAQVKEARGRGLLLALELFPRDGFSTASLYDALLARGFVVGHYPAGNILRIDPALTIEQECLDRFLETLDSVLTDTHHGVS
jgi:acetylornithine/N-succinyldiaminopimelate aminotransferase